MLTAGLCALALVSPNAEQLVVTRGGDHVRPDPRAQTRLRKLKRLRAPMAPRVELRPTTPDILVPAAADGPNGIIYSDGPLDDFTMAHETYHLLDAQVMTDADRRRFAMIMGQPDAPWDVGTSGARGPESQGYRYSLSEQFADMAAMVAIHRDPRGQVQDYAYLDKMPSRKKLLRFGRALERLGNRYGLAEYERPR